jgi:hypothetical protein
MNGGNVAGLIVGLAVLWLAYEFWRRQRTQQRLRRMADRVHADESPMEAHIAGPLGVWRMNGPTFGVWVRPSEPKRGGGERLVAAYPTAEAAAASATGARRMLEVLADEW